MDKQSMAAPPPSTLATDANLQKRVARGGGFGF